MASRARKRSSSNPLNTQASAPRPRRPPTHGSQRLDEANRKDWAAKKFAALREDCKQQHGTAFKHYINCLVKKEPAQLIGEINKAMIEFDGALDLKTDISRAIRHAAKNFSIIYAGGVLAIEAGLLPIKKERLLKSIVQCFNDGLKAIEPPKDLEANAVKQLIAGLEKADVPEKSDLKPDEDPVGFQRPLQKGDLRVLYAIKPTCFVKWFADEPHYQAALRWMASKDVLLLREGKTMPDGRIVTDDVVSFEKRVGDNGKREQARWIRFLDPRRHAKGRA